MSIFLRLNIFWRKGNFLFGAVVQQNKETFFLLWILGFNTKVGEVLWKIYPKIKDEDDFERIIVIVN